MYVCVCIHIYRNITCFITSDIQLYRDITCFRSNNEKKFKSNTGRSNNSNSTLLNIPPTFMLYTFNFFTVNPNII